MNSFLFLVDGRLMPPDFFSAKTANTADRGIVAMVKMTHDFKKEPKFIDVLEVRSGHIVRRYNLVVEQGDIVRTEETDKEPGFSSFVCKSVANTIF